MISSLKKVSTHKASITITWDCMLDKFRTDSFLVVLSIQFHSQGTSQLMVWFPGIFQWFYILLIVSRNNFLGWRVDHILDSNFVLMARTVTSGSKQSMPQRESYCINYTKNNTEQKILVTMNYNQQNVFVNFDFTDENVYVYIIAIYWNEISYRDNSKYIYFVIFYL